MADAIAASFDAAAAFPEAVRACWAVFLAVRPIVPCATGDELDAGVGLGAIAGVDSGVGDLAPKKFVTPDVPDIPPAHPARKIEISDKENTPEV